MYYILYYSFTILLNYYITILKNYYTTILLYYYITILLYYYITILLHYYITTLLYYYITILLYYYITVLLYYSITILLYYYISTLLYYYMSVLLYHRLCYYMTKNYIPYILYAQYYGEPGEESKAQSFRPAAPRRRSSKGPPGPAPDFWGPQWVTWAILEAARTLGVQVPKCHGMWSQKPFTGLVLGPNFRLHLSTWTLWDDVYLQLGIQV